MNSVHFYDLGSGEIMPNELKASCPDFAKFVTANTPEGYAPIYWVTDPMSQRVDLSTGEIVDYQPPQPDAEHVWDVDARRWIKRPDVIERERLRLEAQSRIDDLERRQARRVRELLAASDPALKTIDDEIAQLRAVINGERETSAP